MTRLYDLCIWGFDSCILGTLEHVMFDIVGGYPKAYVDVLGVLRVIGVSYYFIIIIIVVHGVNFGAF